MGAPGCSVKTPGQNDVSSMRPRSGGLQLGHSGDEDTGKTAGPHYKPLESADEFVRQILGSTIESFATVG